MDNVIATMRQNLQDWLLTERATLYRRTGARDEMGAAQQSVTLIAENIPCRVMVAGDSNVNRADLQGAQEAVTQLYKIALPPATDVRADDQLSINGLMYHVVALRQQYTDALYVTVIGVVSF